MIIGFGGEGVEAELVRIINAAYDAGEAGIWQPGWQRVTRRADARSWSPPGEIAVAGGRRRRSAACGSSASTTTPRCSACSRSTPAAHGTGLGKALIAFAEDAYDVD